MKSLLIILAYLAGTVLLGAVLAPALHEAVRAIEPWALANGLLRFDPPLGGEVVAKGPLAFLESDFQKLFNRSVLAAAVLLLWPTIRLLGLRGWADFYLRPDLRWRQHLGYGLQVAAGSVALMGGAYLLFDYYHLKTPLPWAALPRLALTAAVVGVMEEVLFRGAILGLFLRTMRPTFALFWTTLLFASVHFLKPDPEVTIQQVTWSSGFTLLPHAFHQFGDPQMWMAYFATLFVLGWMCGYVRLRTGALWMSMGIHAGVVFVKMGFAKLTIRDAQALPWVGKELQIGIVPVGLLLVALLILWRRLEYEELLPNPRRRV